MNRAMRWAFVAALLSALTSPAAGAGPARPVELPTRRIAVVVNGTTLPADPAPLVIGGHLYVPVTRIYGALAIPVARDGKTIVATAANKVIRLTIGSTQAFVDERSVILEGPALEVKGATYVPLRFVTDSLGAVVSYNVKDGRVEIVSSLVGRAPSLNQSGPQGQTTVSGIVSAIDLNSSPPSVTVVRGPSIRTISINSTAKTTIEDVSTRTTLPGTLAAVHVGDSVSITLAQNGAVLEILDLYASRQGTVVAVNGSQIVLNNGRVVTPTRATTITLNGEPSSLGDVKTGDDVLVRSNPETGEDREVIVSRQVAAASASAAPESSASPVTISSFTIDAQRPLRAGESFDVTLTGTPGGRATYDIGTFITAQPLRESAPGTYTGRYTVQNALNLARAPVFGHLNVNGVDAPRAQAATTLSIVTLPPQITDVAPIPNQSVNNPRPSIYATFTVPTDVPINPGSATIDVNGQDVTPTSTRTDGFITYSPPGNLNDGPVNVTVRVADLAGNVTTRTWSFTIRTH